ncbi:MAG: acetoin utilization protein AcuC [Steroidobacteraceae bacterium]
MSKVQVIADEPLGRYGFPDGHPFGTDRQAAFLREFRAAGLNERTVAAASRAATVDELLRFHTAEHVAFVRERSATGGGYLDSGDTPAVRGIYEAAAQVVGASLEATAAILRGDVRRAFVPIAGLHHATRSRAAGFCVFNDIGVVVETLRREGLRRVAYVDIDVHHGDGVYFSFEDDPFLVFADTHEDGRFLYPGTGAVDETGTGSAEGTKLNVPLAPGSGPAQFAVAWQAVLTHVARFEPEFIVLQCGADSLGGDPLAHLQLTAECHGQAARDLCALAERLGHGRILGLGGGGYNRANLAKAWTAVVAELVAAG